MMMSLKPRFTNGRVGFKSRSFSRKSVEDNSLREEEKAASSIPLRV